MKKVILSLFILSSSSKVFSGIEAVDIAYPGVCNKVGYYQEILEKLEGVPDAIEQATKACSSGAKATAENVVTQVNIDQNIVDSDLITEQVAEDTEEAAAAAVAASAGTPAEIPAEVVEDAAIISEEVAADATEVAEENEQEAPEEAEGETEPETEPECDAAVKKLDGYIDDFENVVEQVTALNECSSEYRGLTVLVEGGSAKYPECIGDIGSLIFRVGAVNAFGGLGIVAEVFADLSEVEIINRLSNRKNQIVGLITKLTEKNDENSVKANSASSKIAGEIEAILGDSENTPISQEAYQEIYNTFVTPIDESMTDLKGNIEDIADELSTLQKSQNPELVFQLAAAACSRWVPECKIMIITSCIEK